MPAGPFELPHPLETPRGIVTIRAMRPEDAVSEQAFVRGLSSSARENRFFTHLKELPPGLLYEFTHPDYPRTCALVALSEQDGQIVQVGVARYAPAEQADGAEFAVVVADDWQGLGIATSLMAGLLGAAGAAGFRHLEGLVLRDNGRMLELARSLGFRVAPVQGDPSVFRVVKRLDPAPD